jgi:NTE family protein
MNLRRRVQLLGTPGVFLARATLEKVIPRAQISASQPGELIATARQLAEFVFLVLGGTCEQSRTQPDGTREIFNVYKAGDTFGGTDAAPDCPPVEVRAGADCVTLKVRPEVLEDVMDENPPVALTPTLEQLNHRDSEPNRGRVVTLDFLTDGLPIALMAEQLARALFAESGDSDLLLQLVAGVDGDAVHCSLNGKPLALGLLPPGEGGFSRLRLGVPAAGPGEGRLGELLSSLRRRFDHVLVSGTEGNLPATVLDESVCNSDVAYLFIRPEDLSRLLQRTCELRVLLNSHIPTQLRPVLCLASQESPGGCEIAARDAAATFHSFVRGCPVRGDAPTGCFRQDIRRMAREICDRLVGLVLSSGGAKGYAHIGVIQVLEENGIEVDVVAGASMGAYLGALWAHGCDAGELEKLAHDMESRWAMWSLLDLVLPPRRGFLRGFAVKQRLMRTIGPASFGDLRRPLRVVATNLNTLERVVFATGDVAAAVHASIAVPGICVPVTIGEATYVDGGIVDPLPVDVLREMGVRRIIASNTIPTPETIRQRWIQAGHLPAQGSGGGSHSAETVPPLEKHLNYFAPGNILEILMNSIHGAQIRVAETACRRASIVLRPDIRHDRWMDFRNPRTYIAAGRQITLRHLEEIKALVRQKGKRHESSCVPDALAAVA